MGDSDLCNVHCQVLYIDYGNSEVLNRSDIVEIPPNLQCPSVAKKYRLWGLQIPTDQNLNMFDEELSASLEMVYGQGSAADGLEDAFQQFFEWKSIKMKKLICIRDDTDTALEILADWFSSILKEPDEAEKGIIMNAYNKVIHNVRQEQSMITVIQNKYLASVESDDYSEFEMTGIKEEIAHLRNRVLQEISKEQEEYEKLTYLVQKWFPELPLLYPEVGILNYMNSGGLLTRSLERDLLDAEPMKELSTKRPLVCSEIQGQKVLLKILVSHFTEKFQELLLCFSTNLLAIGKPGDVVF
ncbi:serine threonine-protein kinase hypothetical protein [Limosa lapponica baueri]|uniref:Tudor domain-containing protein n=1 Tax=Limosa lapponica baueri TaxID=1758121 RepID=A0A2I0TF75_LIMLA|nr:serine threonine-protein kinase hypothetical protein [Limosa lapponica baueri]